MLCYLYAKITKDVFFIEIQRMICLLDIKTSHENHRKAETIDHLGSKNGPLNFFVVVFSLQSIIVNVREQSIYAMNIKFILIETSYYKNLILIESSYSYKNLILIETFYSYRNLILVETSFSYRNLILIKNYYYKKNYSYYTALYPSLSSTRK